LQSQVVQNLARIQILGSGPCAIGQVNDSVTPHDLPPQQQTLN